MGTETWIISLPLSDSILYLKIIHPPNFREEPKIMRHLIGRGTEVSCDRQGRILIPSHLREFAQLKKDVCIIGTGAIIEIWDPELLDADENGEESVAEIADSLDLPLNFDL